MSFSFPTPWAASWEPGLEDADDVAEFLLERLVEGEPAALDRDDREHVLRDIASKRHIVRLYKMSINAEPGETLDSAAIRVARLTLAGVVRTLAAAYAGHADYRPEWWDPIRS